MPTDEATQPEVNAPSPDVSTHQETPEITDDLVKSHPLFQELEKKHAEARKGMDHANIKMRKLEKSLKEDNGDDTKEEKAPDDIDDWKNLVKWELSHSDDIAVAEEEYETYKSKGYSKEDSLRLAHLDKGITHAPSEDRKSTPTTGGATVNRDLKPSIPDDARKDMAIWGYSEETYLKHKDEIDKMRRR